MERGERSLKLIGSKILCPFTKNYIYVCVLTTTKLWR
jgi:hypothetical protein